MECVICLNEINKDEKVLDCNHVFHKECIEKWMKEKTECPICRVDVEEYRLETNENEEILNANIVDNIRLLKFYEHIAYIDSVFMMMMALLSSFGNEMILTLAIYSMVSILYIRRKANILAVSLFGIYLIISLSFIQLQIFRNIHSIKMLISLPILHYLMVLAIVLTQYSLLHCIDRKRNQLNLR